MKRVCIYLSGTVVIVREKRINELTATDAVKPGLNNRAHGNVEFILCIVVNVWICVSRGNCFTGSSRV